MKLGELGFDKREMDGFERDLCRSGLPSVDIFLINHRPRYDRIGKAALALTLIQCERTEALFATPAEDGELWYRYFFNLMGTTRREFHASARNLQVVTFNYERSLEYALAERLRTAFNETDDEIRAFFKQFNVLHVYGQLGKPDFLAPGGRAYTPDLSLDSINTSISQISLFDEEIPDQWAPPLFIGGAQVLCFLGFGYYPANLGRLGIDAETSKKRVLGTAFGLEPVDRQRVKSKFSDAIELGGEGESIGEFLRTRRNWVSD